MKMPIPTDWDGESFCRFAVCWPDSPLWRVILRGLLTEATRGYFWDERTGNIKNVLSGIRQTMDYNLELECVIMSCGDATELITALNTNFANLIETIQALQLSVTVEPASPTINVEPASPTINVEPASPTINVEPASPDVNLTCAPDVNVTCGGGGGSYPPGSGPYGQGPIIQPPANPGQTTPGPGPGGYEPPESWPGTTEEFDLYKCQASNWLVDAYIQYVQGWANNYENINQVISLENVLAVIFAGSPFISLLSPDALVVLGSYLTTIEYGFIVSENLVDAYLEYLQEIHDDWVCDYYNAPTVPAARAVTLNYVGGGGLVAWPSAVTEFHVDVMFKDYTLNVLFEEYGPAVGYDGTMDDCMGCDDAPCQVTRLWPSPVDMGSFVWRNDTECLINSAFSGVNWVQVAFYANESFATCGPVVTIDELDFSVPLVDNGALSNGMYRVSSNKELSVFSYNSDEPPTLPLTDVGGLVFWSADPFNVHIKWHIEE